MQSNNYNYISIGLNCLSAAIIKVYGLKKFSTLFDWSLNSIDTLLIFLENNKEYALKNLHLINFVHHKNKEEYQIRATCRFYDILKNSNKKIFFLSTENNYNLNNIKKIISLLEKKCNNFKIVHIAYELIKNKNKLTLINNKLTLINNKLTLINSYDKYDLYKLESLDRIPFSLYSKNEIEKYKIFSEIILKYDPEIDINKIFNDENINKFLLNNKNIDN